jgi:TRIAD3 protein (E3 ubiquitin-protein ligase RNF216)
MVSQLFHYGASLEDPANYISYVCSENVVNYEHFGDVGRGRCPLHDNVEDRHEQEVKKAADEAMAKVRTDNPGLSEADLMIKVSDRVKQAEDARKGQAQAHANAFPYHMVDNQLQQRMGHLPPPPPPPVVPGYGGVVPMQPPVAQYVPVYPYAVQPIPMFGQPVHYFQPPLPYGAVGPAPQQPQQYVPFYCFPPYLFVYPRPYNYLHPPNHFH